jgi:hypothetical protein
MVSKKHCAIVGKELNAEELKISNKLKAAKKISDSKSYQKVGKKARREKYNNDPEYKEYVLRHCKDYCDRNREKVRDRNNEYGKKHWWVDMISSSKFYDKKYKRYTGNDYVDKNFLIAQKKKQKTKCFYCSVKMTKRNGKKVNPTRMTIERIDNDIEHNKENCILSCWSCNHSKHVKGKTHDEWLHIKSV